MINELTLTDVIETKNVETLRKKIIEVWRLFQLFISVLIKQVYGNNKKIIDEIFSRMHPESIQDNQPDASGL
jgi:CRISPR/Cas system-associated protein Csx1